MKRKLVQSGEQRKHKNEREMRTREKHTDWIWARVLGNGVRTQF